MKNNFITEMLHSVFRAKSRFKHDRADVAQMLIIVAGLAGAAIIAIAAISQSTLFKGEEAAKCISNYQPTKTEGGIQSDCSREGTDGGSDGIFMCWEDIASFNNQDLPKSLPGEDPIEGGFCFTEEEMGEMSKKQEAKQEECANQEGYILDWDSTGFYDGEYYPGECKEDTYM